MRVKQQVASVASTADEFRLILKILVGTSLVRMRREWRGERFCVWVGGKIVYAAYASGGKGREPEHQGNVFVVAPEGASHTTPTTDGDD
jgi:hypothetical protein